MTSQEPFVAPRPGWVRPLVTGTYLFFSPNIIWLTIALTIYFLAPYDIQAAKTLDNMDWIFNRFWINFVVTFGYYGFWRCTLDIFGWSSRPFNPQRLIGLAKVLHNMFYSFLGVIQYTAWEAIFLHCYATGRLPFLNNQQVVSSFPNIAIFVLSFFFVPLFRGVHFYFSHRFIHIRALYKHIHAVHHRNTDIEPFAGLSMHPIEHLYYFSCLGPSLLILGSPFLLLWNGIHLLLSPGAGHSGWEDALQSNQYHYLHHRFFECNYGDSGTPYDKIFGTFRDKLKESGTTYQGGSEEKVDEKSARIHDTKATLLGLPDPSFVIYLALNCLVWVLIWKSTKEPLPYLNPHFLAALASVGPVALAQLMVWTQDPRRPILYPFQRDSVGTVALHLLLPLLLCIGPVYTLVDTLLAPPGDALFFKIRG